MNDEWPPPCPATGQCARDLTLPFRLSSQLGKLSNGRCLFLVRIAIECT